jgi:putative hemolysin
VSARKARLQQRADEGDASAAAALALAHKPDSFLSALQIGITLVGILAGAFGGATVAEQLTARLDDIPALAPYSNTLAIVIVVLIITYLTLVLGELAPKQIALNSPERIAMRVARPVSILVKITSPAVRFLAASSSLLLRLLRVRPPEGPPITEEEIRLLLAQATDAGVFEEEEEDLVSGIFRLGDLRAASLMTPRTELYSLDLADTPEETLERIAARPRARYPVVEGNPDNVAGVIHAHDLLARSLRGESLDLRAMLHPPVFVPESAPALDVLRAFLSTGDSLCFVIDEYGGLQGVATMDDVTRVVSGDLEAFGPATRPKATQRPDGSWLVDGLMTIEAFRQLFDLESLPEEGTNTYETVGGFAMTSLGRIPEVTDSFAWGGLLFEVLDMDGRRVDKLLVRKA